MGCVRVVMRAGGEKKGSSMVGGLWLVGRPYVKVRAMVGEVRR